MHQVMRSVFNILFITGSLVSLVTCDDLDVSSEEIRSAESSGGTLLRHSQPQEFLSKLGSSVIPQGFSRNDGGRSSIRQRCLLRNTGSIPQLENDETLGNITPYIDFLRSHERPLSLHQFRVRLEKVFPNITKPQIYILWRIYQKYIVPCLTPRPPPIIGPNPLECPYKFNCAEELCPILNCEAHESTKPICGCCKVCKKELHENCGLSAGHCKDNLVCQVNEEPMDVGFCVTQGINHNVCPINIVCPAVVYSNPYGCQCGVAKAPCGCQPLCKSCENEKCGLSIAACDNGLECFTPQGPFTQGKCVKLPTYHDGDCTGINCLYYPSYCQNGRYSCCDNCKLGPDESCSDTSVPCGDGLACIDGKCTWVTTPAREECPSGNQCNGYTCPTVSECEHGSEIPDCACCPACKRKPGELCGAKIGVCIEGYKCEGINKKICVKDSHDCSRVFCPHIFCEHGSFFKEGDCCPTCKVGQYGTCSSDDMCQDGLTCMNGKCKSTFACPFKPNCERVRCKIPDCGDLGFSIPQCMCCPFCRRGAYKSCGPDIGNCLWNYKCKFSHNARRVGTCVPKDCSEDICPLVNCQFESYFPTGKCCATCKLGPFDQCTSDVMCADRLRCIDGICKDPKCLNKPNCALISCPAPKYCRHGSSAPRCQCCPVCNSGPFEACGNELANCRKGYHCINRIGKCYPHKYKEWSEESNQVSSSSSNLSIENNSVSTEDDSDEDFQSFASNRKNGNKRRNKIKMRFPQPENDEGLGNVKRYIKFVLRQGDSALTLYEFRVLLNNKYPCLTKPQIYVLWGIYEKYILPCLTPKPKPPTPPTTPRCIKQVGKIPKSENDEGLGNIRPLIKFVLKQGNSPLTLYQFRLLFNKNYPKFTKPQIYVLWRIYENYILPCFQQEPPFPPPPPPPPPGGDCVRPDCSAVSCVLPPNCEFGVSTPRCSCCPSCKRGAGEKCGPTLADCRDGYDCKQGICVKKVLDCSKVTCPQIRCAYGSYVPEGKCCPTCKVGRYSKCSADIMCRCNLKCVNGKCQKSFDCPDKPDCRVVRCGFPICEGASSIPQCSCCPFCNRKEKETCGPDIGNCDGDLECQYPDNKTRTGTCVPAGCGSTICPLIKCQFGSYTPSGKCCPTCKVGSWAECTSDIMCAENLKCLNGVCRGECFNNPNHFCYICGEYNFQNCRRTITPLIRARCKDYFRMKLGIRTRALF